jgi:tRNA(fMet)-specific endonuclease VapC
LHNIALIDALQFVVLEFDKEDARQAAEVRALLASRGAQIGPYDVLIAGQAIARRMILVTHNIREFGRVPGLRFEDWLA